MNLENAFISARVVCTHINYKFTQQQQAAELNFLGPGCVWRKAPTSPRLGAAQSLLRCLLSPTDITLRNWFVEFCGPIMVEVKDGVVLQPRSDKRAYRWVRLENELQALLISDPETDKVSQNLQSCFHLKKEEHLGGSWYSSQLIGIITSRLSFLMLVV